jgi:CRISPR-associated endonuclease/helicase Cas3
MTISSPPPTGGPWAHSANDKGEWHDLREHLAAVAKLARQFAEPFGAGDWAELAGWWHDLGKCSPAFQEYLKAQEPTNRDAHLEGTRRTDHSTAGAIHAVHRFGLRGRVLAYLIAGHHAGLPDWFPGDAEGGSLNTRLAREDLYKHLDKDGLCEQILREGQTNTRPPGGSPHLWIRMLFSCLADADFLDTEAHFHPEQAAKRSNLPTLDQLKPRFDRFMEKEFNRARRDRSAVNAIRDKVLQDCRAKAALAPGLFSLNVPTGGGKTLSSMAFALEHAAFHGHQRIIYVIPYTSIIEQTADVFRGIFGDGVVEHHSNLDPEVETNANRLASENWDAPIIVTTSVQFFESLYTARPSRARKLHNIVNTVVILDEVQLLPPDLLEPILRVIENLTAHYGVTCVLSTATQPALAERRGFGWHFKGLSGIRDIIERPEVLHESMRRVRIELPADLEKPMEWQELKTLLITHEKVLCIVNRRSDARELAGLMPEGTVHLSALMCGEHRSRVIGEIKERLGRSGELRVVSTQLVEAGVDLDFPVVYRALTGMDSIAQAGGRCNREGLHSPDECLVRVFVPPKPSPAGLLRKGEQVTRELIQSGPFDPLAPATFHRYFESLYWSCNTLDRLGVLDLLKPGPNLEMQLRTAGDRFRFIDEAGMVPIVVCYGESPGWIGELRRDGSSRAVRRRLQRFIVTVPLRCRERLVQEQELEEVIPGVFWQVRGKLYDQRLGFMGCEGVGFDASELIT